MFCGFEHEVRIDAKIMKVKICQNCGTKNRPQANFCKECGTNIKSCKVQENEILIFSFASRILNFLAGVGIIKVFVHPLSIKIIFAAVYFYIMLVLNNAPSIKMRAIAAIMYVCSLPLIAFFLERYLTHKALRLISFVFLAGTITIVLYMPSGSGEFSTGIDSSMPAIIPAGVYVFIWVFGYALYLPGSE